MDKEKLIKEIIEKMDSVRSHRSRLWSTGSESNRDWKISEDKRLGKVYAELSNKLNQLY